MSRSAVTLAIQNKDVRLCLRARKEAPITYAAKTVAVAEAGNTLNRSVSSQSMGARINADVAANVVRANHASAG